MLTTIKIENELRPAILLSSVPPFTNTFLVLTCDGIVTANYAPEECMYVMAAIQGAKLSILSENVIELMRNRLVTETTDYDNRRRARIGTLTLPTTIDFLHPISCSPYQPYEITVSEFGNDLKVYLSYDSICAVKDTWTNTSYIFSPISTSLATLLHGTTQIHLSGINNRLHLIPYIPTLINSAIAIGIKNESLKGVKDAVTE